MSTRLVLWFGVLAIVSSARAQNVNGAIVGTIKDPSGGVIASAAVTVTNQDTNISYKAATDTTGDYVVPNLPPGAYTVKTEMTGFRQNIVKDVVLLANRSMRVDVLLEPGTLAQSVEVQAAAPVVNSENSTIGNVLQSKTIATLPLNGRTLDRLLRISAGVTTDSGSNPRVAGSSYWGGIQFNVDGITYNDTGNGGAAYSYRSGLSTLPSIDATQEFKIDSNNQKAEFEASASVMVVTKSGTNEFHGSAFEFNRNRAYAAKNFFLTGQPKPAYNRNEFGATIGGPIIKNKTFFFGDYEGLRERQSRANSGLSLPTAAMRDGDFSGLAPIMDPLSGQAFGGNQIPSSRIDTRAKTLLNFVPPPNQPGNLNNYSVNIPQISDINRYGVRLDHRFSDRDSFWGNYNYSKGSPYFVAQAYPPSYGQWSDGGYETANLGLTWTHSLSARTLNEARFGWLYHGSVRRGMNLDYDPTQLFPGLYKPPLGGLPRIDITNYTAIGDYGGSARGKEFTNQYIDNFSHVAGRHTMKAGIDFANYRVSTPPGVSGLGTSVAQDAGFGRFTFTGRYSGNSVADFLLGYPVTTYRSTPYALSLFYQTRYSAFVQDDWQVSPKLTLNAGVRYMIQTSWKERDRAQANFDFGSGQLVIPGDKLPPQTNPRLASAYPIVTRPGQALDSDKRNFAPRVGFAYRPFGKSTTVIRGGAGMFYNALPLFIGFRQLGLSNPPFQLSETFDSAPGGLPSLTLANPFPGSGSISPNPAITAVEGNIHNSVSQQWNLTVEREVARSLGLRASYIGNKTSHLPWYNRSINVPARMIPGPLQPNRPYQPWSDINLLASGGDSTLHQLQLEAVQRFSHGLNFQAEYAWTRSLDDVPIVGGPQNVYNNRGDRGNSEQVRRHIFTLAWSYDLPFGAGKRFHSSSVANRVIGGWQLAGITYLRTGTPFSVTFTNTAQGALASRADLTGNPKLDRDNRSINGWFNVAAFAVPAPFTFGNSARNLLFGPGDIVIDFSVLKDTKITERATLQFRAEAFNLPNHANFNNPAANISVPSQVGRIFSAQDPRQIQFGAKFLF